MLGFLYVSHIPIDELKIKLGFLAIAVLHVLPGQADYPLAAIPTCFHIPIDEPTTNLRLLAITVLHPPRAGGLSPCWESYMFVTFPSMA